VYISDEGKVYRLILIGKPCIYLRDLSVQVVFAHTYYRLLASLKSLPFGQFFLQFLRYFTSKSECAEMTPRSNKQTSTLAVVNPRPDVNIFY